MRMWMRTVTFLLVMAIVAAHSLAAQSTANAGDVLRTQSVDVAVGDWTRSTIRGMAFLPSADC